MGLCPTFATPGRQGDVLGCTQMESWTHYRPMTELDYTNPTNSKYALLSTEYFRTQKYTFFVSIISA